MIQHLTARTDEGMRIAQGQFKLIDYSGKYSNLVSFGSNKFQSTHRWYSFVEGYSSEFVRRIIKIL